MDLVRALPAGSVRAADLCDEVQERHRCRAVVLNVCKLWLGRSPCPAAVVR
jgi:hypothetical protein